MDTVLDDDDLRDSLLNNDHGIGPVGEGMDQERRIRREIANSNERRRMQSINSGFQSLRTLLPHHEGEKLSKAAILQQTAEYIYTLEQEKTLLLSQNSQLKRLLSLNQQRVEQHPEGSTVESTSPQLKKKRPNLLNEATILGTTILEDNNTIQEDQNASTTTANTNVSNMNLQLMEEQRLRLRLEDRVKSLERQLSMSSSSQQLRPASNINPEPPLIVSNREPAEQTITILTTAGGNENLLPNAEQILSRSNPIPPNLTTARLPTALQAPPTAILLQAAAASAATSSTIPVTARVNPSPAASQITVAMSGPPNTHTISLSNDKNMVAVPAAVLQAAMAASKKENEMTSQVPPLKRVEIERLPTFQPSLPPPTLPLVPLPRQSPQNQPQQTLGSRGTTIIKLDTAGNELREGKQVVGGSSITLSGERRFTPEVCIVPNVQNAPGTTRIPSLPNVPNISVCTTSQSSRQNLDSIVEAIRHLEGDHLFSEDHHHQVVKEEVVDYSTTSAAAITRPDGQKTSTSSTNSLIVPISSVSNLSSSSALPCSSSVTTVVPASINSQLSQAGIAIAALPTLPIPPHPPISASSNIVTVQKSISLETIQLPQQPCSVSLASSSIPATISAVATTNQYTHHQHPNPSRPEGGSGSIIILKQP